MERKKKYRVFLYVMLILSILLLIACWFYFVWVRIPATLHIRAGEEQEVNLSVPVSGKVYQKQEELRIEAHEKEVWNHVNSGKKRQASVSVDLTRPVTLFSEEQQTYSMDLKLFGLIPFKTVRIEVVQEKELIPAGIPVGIYLKTEGILVIATGDFEGEDGQTKEPAGRLLQVGDYILKADGAELAGKAELIQKINDGDGEEMILSILRDGQEFDVELKPQKGADGEYKLGIWVRDNAQGVGTMTFLDEEYRYGALGHGINDMDTAMIMELRTGSLYRTEIIAITKGENGTPGELTGVIDYKEKNRIGTIEANTEGGIFGTIGEETADAEWIQTVTSEAALPVAYRQEVQIGPAQIRSCIGAQPQYYDIEITELHLDHDNINRGIELKVTDQELLDQTGGIVQGMSGSPIIQNGKIIGAVTHVLVNDPTRGYGIFIENMLDEAA